MAEKKCCNSLETASEKQQIAIIGSGAAAFACAIKAAEAGAEVTIIEAGVVGGCCVNVGCIPSKIMIKAAQLAQQQRKNAYPAIKDNPPVIDRALLSLQLQNRVDELRDAKYENIVRSNDNIRLIKGFARFSSINSLKIKKQDGSFDSLYADRFLIATGSSPYIPPISGLADLPYWTSTEALFATRLPERLLVIGSSVVALELAQAYQRLGTQVTLIARHTLLYREDPELGAGLRIALTDEGMSVFENQKIHSAEYKDNLFTVSINNQSLQAEKLLIATGRHANTQSLHLSQVGIETNNSGEIMVNGKMETSQTHIYAAGDCASMPQFVYVAAAAGTRAATNMTGGDVSLDLNTMPAVIFTDPQVATVGLSENRAKDLGIKTESRTLALENVPRALVNFETTGFIKLVIKANTRVLIGAQILAHDGGEIVQTAVLAIHNRMTIEALAAQLFPYLTLVEGLKLCAQTFNKDVAQLSCCAG
ncbi:mercury(II) reductase [Psychromonas sp. MB-3u-54]|uniref:mercury(II) reductase n=1 Tax=Psychromonas sp. MB-3u-54 TaxID=2058319 RepID=UPI000C34CF49|nr:mercury(II) reductase [Psychromonas sp. MB-3u-54]PKH01311.1 mercury(II) reductase [Psychromonas sp. MB-3u-54]